MLIADGGRVLSDLATLRDQAQPFGPVASDPTLWRALNEIGAGPVSMTAANSAMLQGASQAFVVDHIAEQLALAEKFGAIGIDATEGDPVERITEATRGEGVDRGVEAVGYQAHDSRGEEHPTW